MLLPAISFAQSTFTGTVIDKKNAAKLPFATVSLVKENIGVNSDENGYFVLKTHHLIADDTLVISSVGYVSKKIAVSIADSNLNIRLDEQIATLDEVVIDPNYKWTTSTLNDFANCGDHFIATSGYMQQAAQQFHISKEYARLVKLRICRAPGRPGKSTFRIRVYDIDTLTGGPGIDLCDKVIEVKSGNATVKVNLESYNISIPHQDFFVAIEWLKIPGNEQEIKHENPNVPPDYKMYSPSIGWQDQTEPQPEGWFLNYNGTWKQLNYTFKNRKTLLIAATVKY